MAATAAPANPAGLPKGKTPLPPPAGGTSNYQQMHDQFSQMPPPDPATFLKMIWPILTAHQRDLITALLNSPQGAPAGATGAANTPPPPPTGGTPSPMA